MMTDDELARIEARIERYATDEDMPRTEWEALGVRLHMDVIRLLADAKELRGALFAYESLAKQTGVRPTLPDSVKASLGLA